MAEDIPNRASPCSCCPSQHYRCWREKITPGMGLRTINHALYRYILFESYSHAIVVSVSTTYLGTLVFGPAIYPELAYMYVVSRKNFMQS